MNYIELDVKTSAIMHGYDEDNKEIVENIFDQEYTKKLILVERILSISDQYILVSASHGRVMYWEYKGELQDLRDKLKRNNLIIV